MKSKIHIRAFEICPKCGKKGYRATNLGEYNPVMKCKYCGWTQMR